jgi:streptogramin lyase
VNERNLRSLRERPAPDLWPEIERRLQGGDTGSLPIASEGRTRWSGPTLVLAIIVALALVSGGIWALTKVGSSREPVGPQPPTQTVASPGSITRAPLDAGFGPPQAIAAGEGAAWVVVGTSETDNVVYRVDARSNQATVLPQTNGAHWVAAGEGGAWVTACRESDRGPCRDPVVLRLAPESGEIVATIQLEKNPGQVVTGEGAVWVADADRLVRIDPATNRITGRFDVCCSLWGASYGSVWVADLDGRELIRVDARTGRVLARFPAPRGDPCKVAVGEGFVWVASCLSFGPPSDQPDVIEQIDPTTNEMVDTRSIESAIHLAAGAGFLWLARAATGDTAITLSRIDPRTHESVGEPLKIPFDPNRLPYQAPGPSVGPPLFLAVAGDAVWISDFQDGEVIRIQLPLP